MTKNPPNHSKATAAPEAKRLRFGNDHPGPEWQSMLHSLSDMPLMIGNLQKKLKTSEIARREAEAEAEMYKEENRGLKRQIHRLGIASSVVVGGSNRKLVKAAKTAMSLLAMALAAPDESEDENEETEDGAVARDTSDKPIAIDEGLDDDDDTDDDYKSGPSKKRSGGGCISLEQRIKDLETFKKAKGHLNVPMRFKGLNNLGKFVAKIRQDYWNNRELLDEGLIKRLDDIGFVWRVCLPRGSRPSNLADTLSENEDEDGGKRGPSSGQTSFEQRIRDLLTYKQQYGDFSVPFGFKELNNLGSYVSLTRSHYHRGTRALSQERIDRLNAIGFEWES